MKNKNM